MIVTIDFETYHDKEYNLKKMSTSEYIRDKRFEVICASIKLGNEPSKTYWGKKEIRKALKKINWSNTELLAHHAHFEGLILSHHFNIVPRAYRDTLSMGRALFPKTERNDLGSLASRLGVQNKLTMPDFMGKRVTDFDDILKAEVGKYVDGDVESCAQAYIKMVERFPSDELDLIDITVRMFADPVLLLDVPLAEKELESEQNQRTDAIRSSGAFGIFQILLEKKSVEAPKLKKGEQLTDEKILSSNKLFPHVLKAVGVEPPMKVSKTTGKPTYAISKTDEEFTDLISHTDPKVSSLVRGRLAAKSTIGETRAARLLRSGSGGQALPVYLNYYGAHTGRWSGGDKLNYQNLKKKGNIRRAIKAPDGYSLVVIDSSQIEARVVAWLAGEEWVLEAFREKRDLYCEFATVAYNRVITKADKIERFVGKTCVLGLGFQMGGPKLQRGLVTLSVAQGLPPVRLELEECYALVRKYREKNSKIVDLWEFLHNDVISDLGDADPGTEKTYKCITYGHEYIGLPNGLRLLYPETRVKYKPRKKESGLIRNPNGTKIKLRVDEASYATIEGRTKLYGGYLTENIVQALARIIVAKQMLEISKKYRIVMMTHDEVVFMVPTPAADAALKWGLEIMHTPLEWCKDLPVAAEGGHDVCYSK